MKDIEDEIPFAVPEGWAWCRLKDIVTYIDDGDWIESKEQSDFGIRLLQTGNIGCGHFKDKEGNYHYISEATFKKLNCNEIYPGDILISRLPEPVGRACIVPNLSQRLVTAVDCAIIRLKQDMISKNYFIYYTQSAKYLELIKNNCMGTTRLRISRANLEKTLIPLPPLVEQKRIVTAVGAIFTQIALLEQNQADLQAAIKQAKSKILDLAIHGKLVSQDLADEPASVMLEKLRAEKEAKIAAGEIKRSKNDSYIYRSAADNCYYVLCLQLSDDDMKKTCGNGLLHGDIAGIEIAGIPYNLSVDRKLKQLKAQADSPFIDKDKVKKLDTIDAKEIPSDWTLYFKTKVKVKPDSPKTEYTVKLKDAKGLYSEPVTVGTQGKIVTVTFNLAGGNISGDTDAIKKTGVPGASFSAPVPTRQGYTFNDWDPPLPTSPVFPDADTTYTAQWTPKTYTVKFKVDGGHGSLKGTHNGTPKTANGSTEQQFESVPHNSTINFTADPAAGYDVDLWTGATPESGNNKKASLTVQDNVIVTVKFKAVGGQSPAIAATSWEDLRTKVQNASDGTVIEVTKNLTYDISDAAGKESIITVNKNITIKSKDSNTYILNAGGKGADNTASNTKSIGIFEVSGGKTLTLEKLILTKTEKYAIYVAEGDNSLTMKNVTIKDCKTKDNAAGIYFNKGKTLTLENCTIEKCNGNGGLSSGGIEIQAPTEPVSIKDTTIENCKAIGSDTTGGGIHLWNGQCTLENVTVDNCSAKKGGGMCVKKSTLTITGGSFTKNEASGSIANGGGGAIYSEDSTVTITGCTIGGDNVGDGNSAGQGGGIFVSEDARCTLNAGTKISGNKAIRIEGHNSSGGGIFVDKVQSGTQAGTLTINRSSGNPVIISENTADYGGGVYNYGTATINHAEIKGNNVPHHGGGMFNAGTCTMDGVTLQNNKAKSEGGGIYSNKELTLKNTTVTGNEATTSGGAIQIATADAVFNMSGSTVITVEQSGGAAAPSKNDIYLTNDAFITLTGELTTAEKIARITLNSLGGYKNNREIVKGDSGFTIPSGYENKFTITDKIGSQPHWKLISQNHVLKLRLK